MGVSKQEYLDICKELNSEPVEEEIPIEYDDLTVQGQQIVDIFQVLPDRVNSSGFIIGKDMSLIPFLFQQYNLKDTYLYLLLLTVLINKYMEVSNNKIKVKIEKEAAKSGKAKS